MADFDSAGVRLHYVRTGPEGGRPIVLVHGFASDYELNWAGSRWQETMTNAGFGVLGLDCRGHGHSDKPHDPAAYDRREMAADVVRLLDHLGIPRADFLGYSMGARIGLELAIAEPGRLGRVVLGGMGQNATDQSGPGGELIARRLRGDQAVDHPLAQMFYEFASSRPINDLEALACCITGPQTAITNAQLGAISVPIAVMAGDKDNLARGADRLAAAIPGACHVSIEGRTHMNAVPARQFKQAALEFLEAG